MTERIRSTVIFWLVTIPLCILGCFRVFDFARLTVGEGQSITAIPVISCTFVGVIAWYWFYRMHARGFLFRSLSLSMIVLDVSTSCLVVTVNVLYNTANHLGASAIGDDAVMFSVVWVYGAALVNLLVSLLVNVGKPTDNDIQETSEEPVEEPGPEQSAGHRTCAVCSKTLSGRQSKFCSEACRAKYNRRVDKNKAY